MENLKIKIYDNNGDNSDDDSDSDGNNDGSGKNHKSDDDKKPISDTATLTRNETKLKKPSMYKVLLLNDDYTPMEFVVSVLQSFFKKNIEEATEIMLHVHQRGVGICGIYTYEIAETKAVQVMDLAKLEQHPLQCQIDRV